MDFGALPPEVNSARMYSGPGAGSMLAKRPVAANRTSVCRSFGDRGRRHPGLGQERIQTM